jgi:FkbM family methyltransferase
MNCVHAAPWHRTGSGMTLFKSVVRKLLPRRARNWLKHPLKALGWLWCEVRVCVGLLADVEIRPGWRVRSHPAALTMAYTAQLTDPEQAAEFDQFLSSCSPGMRLFDVGAHFGIFSLAAVHYGGETASAIAIDPSPFATRMVRFQARNNHVDDRIRVLQASAGASSGVTQMVAAGIGSAGYFVAPSADHKLQEQTTVKMVSVDQLAMETGSPTHLKIDVEGYEAEVLEGASETLARCPAPLVFLELHADFIRARGSDPYEPLTKLLDAGYRLFDTQGSPAQPNELVQRPLTRLMAIKQLPGA